MIKLRVTAMNKLKPKKTQPVGRQKAVTINRMQKNTADTTVPEYLPKIGISLGT